jgi:hypothetical protein
MNKPDCARSITSLYPASRACTLWSLSTLLGSDRGCRSRREHAQKSRHRRSLAAADRHVRCIVAARKLTTIHHTGAITHVAIPNPNFERGMDIPRFAAILIASCVTEEEQQDLIRLVLGVQEVGCIANTFDFYANQPGRRKVQHHACAR